MLKNSNIIIMLPTLHMGGAERQAIHIANHLKHTHEANVEVLAFSHGEELTAALELIGVPWRLVSFPDFSNEDSIQETIGELITSINDVEPDAILTFTYYPNLIVNIIWKHLNAGACIWNQCDAGVGFGFPATKPSGFDLLALDDPGYAFVSNSMEGKLFLESYYPKQLNVHLIHNGVSYEEPLHNREWWRKAIKVNNEDMVAIMVANLTEVKDHYTLIKAWKEVVNGWAFSGVPILALAGRKDGTYSYLETLTKELNLENHILFLGHVNDISGLLSAADIAVFSSGSEGIPNGVLECMLARLPVVSTDLPGVREALIIEEDYLVKIGDIDEMAHKILQLASAPENWKAIGEQNYKAVTEQFNLQKMLFTYSDLLIQLLSQKQEHI